MFEKIMVIMSLNMVLIAPTAVLAEGATQTSLAVNVAGTVKMADATPVIRLASNDIVPTQGTAVRAIANKNSVVEKSAAEASQIPSQTWLILAALICFVMRSSRRVV